MPAPAAFDYAIIRIVPHEERGEFINAGVILYCPSHRFLDARVEFNSSRLAALAPEVDMEQVRRHLAAIPLICAGGAGAGTLGELTQAERFRWLTSPRNTIIQTSPVHAGLTDNPTETLDHLVRTLVITKA